MALFNTEPSKGKNTLLTAVLWLTATSVAVISITFLISVCVLLKAVWYKPAEVKSLIELLRVAISWPSVVCVLAVAMLSLYREQISRLLDRLATMKMMGVEIFTPLASDTGSQSPNVQSVPSPSDIRALSQPEGANAPRSRTCLLFPFVTNSAGFDTGLVISNTSGLPFGGPLVSGYCMLMFYGRIHGSKTTAPTQISNEIRPGEQLMITMSSGGNGGITATPGFTGFVVAHCFFPQAHGIAAVSDLGCQKVLGTYSAVDITMEVEESLAATAEQGNKAAT